MDVKGNLVKELYPGQGTKNGRKKTASTFIF